MAAGLTPEEQAEYRTSPIVHSENPPDSPRYHELRVGSAGSGSSNYRKRVSLMCRYPYDLHRVNDDHRRECLAGRMTTSIYLERREPAHNRQRFYAITMTLTLVWPVGDGAGVGSDRAAGDGAGDGVRDGRGSLGGGGAMARTEGKTRLSGRWWIQKHRK